MTELQFPSVRLVNATLAQVSLNFRLISASTHELQRQRGCHLEPGTWNLRRYELHPIIVTRTTWMHPMFKSGQNVSGASLTAVN